MQQAREEADAARLRSYQARQEGQGNGGGPVVLAAALGPATHSTPPLSHSHSTACAAVWEGGCKHCSPNRQLVRSLRTICAGGGGGAGADRPGSGEVRGGVPPGPGVGVPLPLRGHA